MTKPRRSLESRGKVNRITTASTTINRNRERKLEYHPEGDYYYGGIPFKITVTGKNKKKPYWVSPKGAGNTALTIGDLSKAYTAATAGLLPNPIQAGINLSQGKVLNALEDMWLYNSAHSKDPNVNYGVVGFSAPEGSLFSSISKAAKATPKQWTAAQDAAIARGDMAEAQRLRDLHFKVSAPKTEVVDINGNPQLVVHKTPETFTVFDNNRSIGKLNWFATPNAYGKNGVFATGAGKNPRTMKLYVNMRNAHKPTIDEGIEPAYINQGEDGILGIVDKNMTNYFKSSRDAGKGFMMSGGVDNPNALKSADAVTYDNNGVRIPLGERDNFKLNDIRYALIPAIATGAAYGVNKMYLDEQRPQKRNGASIYIKPSKRGTFRAAASKHGMGVQEFASRVLANKEDYSSAMVKKANFARNASKWKH